MTFFWATLEIKRRVAEVKTVSPSEDRVTFEDRERDSLFHHSQEEKGVSCRANHKPSGKD